jgi:hypothetical protein
MIAEQGIAERGSAEGSFEFAPAGVVRAAAWPIESLAPFGDGELARSVVAGGSSDNAYTAVIERERLALWQRTADDPRFLKGLAVASESLLARVLHHPGPGGPREKRTRHLETSLYRYLARASTCTTPHGLWAGVSIARFGAKEATAPARARVDFTPDLAPFAWAVAALAERHPYRTVARFRLSPTLHAREGDVWRFLARTRAGDIGSHQLQAGGALASLLERIGDAGTGTLDELAVRARAPRDVLEQLAQAGLLVGGFVFPTRFASPWDALARMEDALLGDDRGTWHRTVSALSELAARLASTFDELSAAALAAEMEKALALVKAFLEALQVAPTALRTALRCDLRSPFSLTLGEETRGELLRGLREHEHELLRATRQRRMALAAHVAARPLPLGEELPPHLPLPAGEDPKGMNGNPWGCLVARLGERRVGVVGVDESPVRPFSRHGALLADADAKPHEVERWVSRLFEALEREHGVVALDLALPFDANPNVLSRTKLAGNDYEPWGISGVDLRGARLASESGALVLEIPSLGRRAVVFAASSAVAVPCDPMAGPLAVMGFAENTEAVVASAQSSGGFVRASSTTLTGQELKALTRLPRRERYGHWLELAANFGWPEHVAVAIDGRRPLVVPTSSPLAIEAAFEGSREAGVAVVEHVDISARVRGAEGRHVADITLPFARSLHAFASLVPPSRSPARE